MSAHRTWWLSLSRGVCCGIVAGVTSGGRIWPALAVALALIGSLILTDALHEVGGSR